MNIPFEKLKARLLATPKVKAEYDALAPEFEISTELIRARLRARLSQAELAARMGTSQSTIARLESGHTLPSTKTLLRYAKATGSRFHIGYRRLDAPDATAGRPYPASAVPQVNCTRSPSSAIPETSVVQVSPAASVERSRGDDLAGGECGIGLVARQEIDEMGESRQWPPSTLAAQPRSTTVPAHGRPISSLSIGLAVGLGQPLKISRR